MQKETARHREAFEYYYELGDKRSLQLVARRFTVSETSVRKWSSDFGWQSRVEFRDNEIADYIEKKRIKQYKKDKEHYYLITQKLIQKFQEKMLRNEIEIKSVADYERLMKISAQLNGESFDANITANLIVNVPDVEDDN